MKDNNIVKLKFEDNSTSSKRYYNNVSTIKKYKRKKRRKLISKYKQIVLDIIFIFMMIVMAMTGFYILIS